MVVLEQKIKDMYRAQYRQYCYQRKYSYFDEEANRVRFETKLLSVMRSRLKLHDVRKEVKWMVRRRWKEEHVEENRSNVVQSKSEEIVQFRDKFVPTKVVRKGLKMMEESNLTSIHPPMYEICFAKPEFVALRKLLDQQVPGHDSMSFMKRSTGNDREWMNSTENSRKYYDKRLRYLENSLRKHDRDHFVPIQDAYMIPTEWKEAIAEHRQRLHVQNASEMKFASLPLRKNKTPPVLAFYGKTGADIVSPARKELEGLQYKSEHRMERSKSEYENVFKQQSISKQAQVVLDPALKVLNDFTAKLAVPMSLQDMIAYVLHLPTILPNIKYMEQVEQRNESVTSDLTIPASMSYTNSTSETTPMFIADDLDVVYLASLWDREPERNALQEPDFTEEETSVVALSIDANRRLEIVWDSLKIPEWSQFEMALKYTNPSKGHLLNDAIVCWELVEKEIAAYEACILQLKQQCPISKSIFLEVHHRSCIIVEICSMIYTKFEDFVLYKDTFIVAKLVLDHRNIVSKLEQCLQ